MWYMKKNRIIAIHLLNDWSGSPLVFREAIEVLSLAYEIHLFTFSSSEGGFLSNIKGVVSHPLYYRRSRYRIGTLLYFFTFQAAIFFRLMIMLQKGDIVYINTLFPFGAALAGRVRGCRVVYHIHDVSITPLVLKKGLVFFVNHCSTSVVFVSDFVASQFHLRVPFNIIYSALPFEFTDRACLERPGYTSPFTVLMICSLEVHKGINEFISLAGVLPDVHFQLVLNASESQVAIFCKGLSVPGNCEIFPSQSDIGAFYQRASMVVNLSLPDLWVETFEMTILESMYYSRPVIVPPIGGLCELVENGIEGFHINGNDISQLSAAIRYLSEDEGMYRQLALAARKKALKFELPDFRQNISATFLEVRSGSSPFSLVEKISGSGKYGI
jgi:glycosyltransferase involved in cell wall biosynthesis